MTENQSLQNPSPDPNDSNDRFMAVIEAAVGEYERKIRQRHLMMATRVKADTGHAVRQPPTGYVADRAGRWHMDPDPVVRQTIARLFTDFERLGMIGNVLRYYRENGIRLPVRTSDLVYQEPSRGRIRAILTHPGYKGDYVFGRRVTVKGQAHRQPNPEEVIVVPNHH